jgi:hypothetical protein
MKNYLIAFGLSAIFASIASAHGITINTGKVIFKQGISKEALVDKMQCLLILKEVKEGETTKERVFEHKMKKIHRVCEKHNIAKAECHAFKKHVAKKLHGCFVGAHFMKEFFGIGKMHEGSEEAGMHERE